MIIQWERILASSFPGLARLNTKPGIKLLPALPGAFRAV